MRYSARFRVVAVVPAALAMLAASTVGSRAAAPSSPILAIGAENEYADVIGQIGGHYVKVSALESNPATDPHSFEASPSIAHEVATASLVVQNGLGYDSFMDRIEAGSPNPQRRVIDVQALLRLSNSTPNPHLWYRPATMPAVATAIADALAGIDPKHASYFRANAAAFDRSLKPWLTALRSFASRHPRVPVAVTEPVADYMLQAAGANILTPFSFQADVMNGVDPSPQDVSAVQALFSQHRVKAFLYNEQVTDTLTSGFLADAAKYHIPVVAVYETMPAAYHYQGWMLAETNALAKAIADHKSTTRL